MTLNEAIYKRKSTRKYHPVSLDDTILQDIKSYIAGIKPLYPDIKVNFEIAGSDSVKNWAAVKAPHYIVVSSENKKGCFVNVGFMLQQVDLYLSSIGLGSCWLGSAKTSGEIEEDKDYVIAMAFGKPLDSPHRELSDFKRKPLEKISNTADARLEVVRLAPSGMNTQSYYFVIDGNIIRAYCGNSNFLAKKMFTKMHEIDIGIALAHLYVANSESFRFFKEENPKEIKGHYYMGSVEI